MRPEAEKLSGFFVFSTPFTPATAHTRFPAKEGPSLRSLTGVLGAITMRPPCETFSPARHSGSGLAAEKKAPKRQIETRLPTLNEIVKQHADKRKFSGSRI